MRLHTRSCRLLLALVLTTGAAGSTAAAQASAATVYGQLPIAFEPNRGQTDPQVKFLSRGKGYAAYLTSDGMMLSLRPSRVELLTSDANTTAPNNRPAHATLFLRLSGAKKNPASIGEDPQPGRVNYFIGNNPAQWKTNIPTYGKVRYRNVYAGIDLVYYGNQRQLEHDFVVAPGADPAQIRYEIQGASDVQLDEDGDLVLTVEGGNLYFQKPAVYQESKGRHIAIASEYILIDATHVSFHLSEYDRTKPLVIDPVLVYSTYVGGGGNNQLSGIAVDNVGSVYIAGYTDSLDFPLASPGSLSSGSDHVFVAKLNASGSSLIYADYLGGNSEDYGYALALDAENHVWVTGSTGSSNFPMVNPYQGTYPGSFNGFVSEISADGSILLYSTYLGGNGSDSLASIAVDASSEILVAGNTTSTNFPLANAYQSSASANQGGVFGNYGFVTKFSPGGSSLIYSTYFGGSSNVALDCGGTPCWPSPYSAISGVAVDSSGNAFVAGTTNTYNFPTTESAYLISNSTQQNNDVGFVAEFTSAGSLAYSTYFYEASGILTAVNAVAVDNTDSAYITGAALSDGTFPITSTTICDPSVSGFACNFAFVTKLNAGGSSLVYSTFLGANNNANPQAIVLDSNNDAYVLASTSGASFSLVDGIESYAGANDLLIAEIDPEAGTELFATYLGGSGDDYPAGIALDSTGNLYVGGSTVSTDLPTTQGAFQNTLAGTTDAFVAKIGTASAAAVALSPYSLQFAAQDVASTSVAQTVLLRNMGSSALSISSVSTSGDFAETSTCGATVPAAANCTLSVTFTPTTTGVRSGFISIVDTAAGSPHIITLTGTGSTPEATLAPASLTFAASPVGSSSAAQTVTLTNSGGVSLAIGGIQVTGDFSQTNNCPASLAAAASCNINVVFTPTATGARSGTLSITDNAQGSPQTASLSGTGSDFSLTSSPTSTTISAGSAATYTLTVASVGGSFSDPVTLSCENQPALSTCSFSPSAVTPGASSATSTLTISTTASVARATQDIPMHKRPAGDGWIQLQSLGALGIVFSGLRRRSKKRLILALLLVLVPSMLLMTGCAGGTGIAVQHGTGSGTFTVTVTGTSGALQHNLPLTLTIQ